MSDLRELEVQTVVMDLLVLGTEPRSSGRVTSTLNHKVSRGNKTTQILVDLKIKGKIGKP